MCLPSGLTATSVALARATPSVQSANGWLLTQFARVRLPSILFRANETTAALSALAGTVVTKRYLPSLLIARPSGPASGVTLAQSSTVPLLTHEALVRVPVLLSRFNTTIAPLPLAPT